MDYDYPGNIRELRNVIERASILAYNDVLRPEHILFDEANTRHLGEPTGKSEGHEKLVTRRRRLDDDMVLQVLKQCNGHRNRAARLLGVSERTLYRYVSKMRSRETAS